MRLSHLQIRDFRCYRHAEISFADAGTYLIVGPNNAGKSTILRAISTFAHAGGPADRHIGGTRASLHAVFTLRDDERRELLQGAEDLDAILISEHYRALRYELLENDQGQLVQQPWAWQLPPSKWKAVSTTGLRGLTAKPIQQRLGVMFQSWKENVFHFSPTRSGASRQATLQSHQELQPDGSNLPQALLYEFTRQSQTWKQLKSLIEELIPDAGHLLVPAIASTVEIVFRDPTTGSERNLKDLGTGVEQLLLTLFAGLRARPDSVLLLEEPENHLHAAAQRRLGEELDRWAESALVVAATHSPILVDARRPATHVFLVRRTGGIASLQAADTELPQVLSALGTRLSDVLSSDRVLVVEGTSDREVLSQWFARDFREHRVTVICAQGGDGSWSADQFTAWLASMDELPRNILFLRDRDELTTAQVDLLSQKPVHVLDVRELENFLMDAEALHALFPSLPPLAHESALRTAADDLRDVVVLKRVAAELTPVRLVDRRAISEFATGQLDPASFAEARF